MRIDGVILPIGETLHLTTVDGKPALIDMGDAATVSEILDSLSQYVAAVKPPLLIEHKTDGLQRGRIVDVYRGENEETGGEAIRIAVDLFDPELMEDAVMIRRFSPFLITGVQTVKGEVYPWALREASIVSVPMIDEGQPDIRIAAASLAGVLREGESCAILAQATEPGANLAHTPGEMTMTGAEILEALRADPQVVAELQALLAPAPAPAEPVAEAVVAAEPVAPAADPMAVAASAKVDALSAKLDRVLAVLPSLPVGAVAVAASAPVTRGVTNPPKASRNERALALMQAEGISYRDAFARVEA